jgi:hypothetical protein
VSVTRIRRWIEAGALGAINTAPNRYCRPRYVVLPEHLAEFERRNRVTPPPKPTPRRKLPANLIDYFP